MGCFTSDRCDPIALARSAAIHEVFALLANAISQRFATNFIFESNEGVQLPSQRLLVVINLVDIARQASLPDCGSCLGICINAETLAQGVSR